MKARPGVGSATGSAKSPGTLSFVLLIAVTALAAAALDLAPALSGHAPPGSGAGLADRLSVEMPFALASGLTGAVLGLLIAWGLKRSLAGASRGQARRDDEFARLEAESAASAGAARSANAQAEIARRAEANLRAGLELQLRHPLAGLSGGALRLADETEPAARRRAARGLAAAADALSAALSDLVGDAEPPFPAVAAAPDLGELVEDVCALHWDQAQALGLDIAAYVDPATPRLAAPEPLALRRLLSALVDQAIEATEAGGVLVELEPDAPGSLRLSVRDTGPGAPRERLPELTAQPGLALAHRLAQAAGWKLQVASEPGRGTAVSLRLAAEAGDAPVPWPKAREAGAPAAIAYEGVATRRALGRYLARAGYRLNADAGEARPALVFGEPDPDAPGPPDLALVALPRPFHRSEVEAALTRAAGGQVAGPALRSPSLRRSAPRDPQEAALLDALDEAIGHDRLSLVYQPQFDREARAILGVEALARWTDPRRGSMDPAVFIPLAEAHGRIQRLTSWVVERALTETADLEGLPVAFNASALEFGQPDMVDRMRALIERTGFDPHRLEVEITETAILENDDQVRDNMNALRALGMGMALDDFGAGYSSLGHLRRYPFDKLKIDRGFVIDCTRDPPSATVVHAVVSIGRALGMKVVAEGVETEQQRQFLKIAGVHAMQGYLFGRPEPIEALKRTLEAHRSGLRARA